MAKRNVLQNIEKGEGQLIGPLGKFSVYSEGEPSCKAGCPAGVDVKAYVNLIADRRYEDAVQVVRIANPFPGICGRVCTHPCEAECGRKDIDEAVSIRTLKRFAADYEFSRKKPMAAAQRKHSHRIAIVGSGPAGLTAASDLALEGFQVDVFDSGKEAGGLLAWGIPDFRLPKNIVRGEVRDIEALGVKIETGKIITQPVKLLEKGYSAVILATGCQSPVLPGIPGEDAAGVIDCLDFLKKAHDGDMPKMSGKALVIGGGNAALDSARTALRLGAKVTLVYRRTEEQMPADREEIEQAKQEGIEFRFLAIPTEIKSGKKLSVKFQTAKLGEPDASGRRSPVPVPGEFFTMDTDSIILAIGSKADVAGLSANGIGQNKNGTLATDKGGMTSVKGVFAAGDITTGPSTIIEAIGSGHTAAAGVMGYLLETPSTPTGAPRMLVVDNPPALGSARCGTCFIPTEKRQSTFDEVEMGLDERAAITEALRCQRCGSCGECSVCLAVCGYRNAAISLAKNGDIALAKIPFAVAEAVMDSQETWSLETRKTAYPVRIEPILARADAKLCIACGKCEESCPYKAIRTVFDTEGNASARVEGSACRGCGACASACPSGAITMGYMDDDKILPRIRDAVVHSAENSGIVHFTCIWNRKEPSLESRPWEVMVQCTRRLSPAILLETLAMGARAIAVRGCEESECHYLPGPLMGPDIVAASREILDAIDINPGRISYVDSLESVEAFFSGIAGLMPFGMNADRMPKTRNGLGRCLNAVQILMAQPDAVPEIKPINGTMIAWGCLATSEPAFVAYGLQDQDVRSAILLLLEKSRIKFTVANGVHISGTSLREWGMDDLYRSYSQLIIGQVKKGKPKRLAVATPKSYLTLGKVDFGCKVVTLPAVLKEKLSGAFVETDETVAYHPACSGGGDFDRDCIELLRLVPGLNISKLEGECGDTGWRKVTAESRKEALALLKRVEKAGISTLVASSTRCAVYLRAAQAGWNPSPVEVVDVYTFLASRLRGDA